MPAHAMGESAVHTCHAECPCQTGGKPMPDFIEGACESVGHDWAPAGGGLWICTECMSEKWGGAGD